MVNKPKIGQHYTFRFQIETIVDVIEIVDDDTEHCFVRFTCGMDKHFKQVLINGVNCLYTHNCNLYITEKSTMINRELKLKRILCD